MSSVRTFRILVAVVATAAATGAGLVAAPAQAATPSTHLVSRGAADQLGNDASGLAAVSDDRALRGVRVLREQPGAG